MPLSRDVFEAQVEIDGQLRRDVHCLSAHRSLGGQRIDQAVLSWELSNAQNGFGGRGDFLQNLDLSRGNLLGKTCQVWRRIPGHFSEIIHSGIITELRPHISEDGIEATMVSRLEPHLFGQPLHGILSLERQPNGARREFFIDAPLVFNPELDGKREPNMSGFRHKTGFSYFLDPESSRSTRALDWRGEPYYAQAWTLAEAVMYLMGVCLSPTTFVTPWVGSRRELDNLFARQQLYNVALPQGKFLPELLDILLEPYGFSWHVSGELRRLEFVRLAPNSATAQGAIVELQRPGEVLNTNLTNAEEINVHYDINKNLVNQVTVRGGYPEVEAAFELVRCWKEDHDTLNLTTDLALDGGNYLFKPEYRDVWRKWALNEAGDYCKLRPEIIKPFDFTRTFLDPNVKLDEKDSISPVACRRRQFLPCLVTNEDGTPFGYFQGIRVQWYDSESWEDVPENESIAVLSRECGILFTGMFPPEYIYRLGSQARVRVIATVRSDIRMSYTVRAKQSVNPHTVPVEIDAAERFNFRRVNPSSPHYAFLHPFNRTPLLPNGEPAIPKPTTQQPFKSVEVDDRAKLKTLAEQLLDRWNRADCSGPIVLTGTDNSFVATMQLGSRVAAIIGRDIKFNLDHTRTRHPIITAFDYDFRNQRTTLTLDTIREEAVF